MLLSISFCKRAQHLPFNKRHANTLLLLLINFVFQPQSSIQMSPNQTSNRPANQTTERPSITKPTTLSTLANEIDVTTKNPLASSTRPVILIRPPTQSATQYMPIRTKLPKIKSTTTTTTTTSRPLFASALDNKLNVSQTTNFNLVEVKNTNISSTYSLIF